MKALDGLPSAGILLLHVETTLGDLPSCLPDTLWCDFQFVVIMDTYNTTGTRDYKRLLKVELGQGAPSGSVEGAVMNRTPDRATFFLFPYPCPAPPPLMLEAGRNCTKPTLFAHALDLLLSD